jgi:hypothetical protein
VPSTLGALRPTAVARARGAAGGGLGVSVAKYSALTPTPVADDPLQNRANLRLERRDVLFEDRLGALGLARGDRVEDLLVLVHARE